MRDIECYDPVNIASGYSVSLKEVLAKIISIDNFNDAKIIFNESKLYFFTYFFLNLKHL